MKATYIILGVVLGLPIGWGAGSAFKAAASDLDKRIIRNEEQRRCVIQRIEDNRQFQSQLKQIIKVEETARR